MSQPADMQLQSLTAVACIQLTIQHTLGMKAEVSMLWNAMRCAIKPRVCTPLVGIHGAAMGPWAMGLSLHRTGLNPAHVSDTRKTP